MKKSLLAVTLASSFFTTGAVASDVQRYTLLPTAEGYVRTDTSTGAISVCTQKADQLVCRMAVDDMQVYEDDLAALEVKIDALKERITALEKSTGLDVATKHPPETELEFQTSLNRMEQFFRKFMGIVKEFQQFGVEPAPEKT